MKRAYLGGLKDVEMKNADGDAPTFEGYASTFGNIDLDGDIIAKGAFTKTLNELRARMSPRSDKIFPMLFNHDLARPIGKFVDAKEDDRGLYVKGTLTRGVEEVENRILPLMRDNVLNKMSIGFFVRGRRWEDETRIITEAELIETSIVSVPANDRADITSNVKTLLADQVISCDDLKHEGADLRDIERALRDGVRLSNAAAKMVASWVRDAREAHCSKSRDEMAATEATAMLRGILSQLNKET